MKYDSEGYDLDAVVSNLHISEDTANNNNNIGKNEVIYEIGGGTTTAAVDIPKTHDDDDDDDRSATVYLQRAESLKNEGNDYYKNHDYIHAYEKYTAAIRTIEVDMVHDPSSSSSSTTTANNNSSKCWTGKDILQRKDLWEQEQHLRLRNELRQRDRNSNRSSTAAGPSYSSSVPVPPVPTSTTATPDPSSSSSPTLQFVLDPPHRYGTVLATYYCNRAAASMQIASSEFRSPYDNNHKHNSNNNNNTKAPGSTTATTTSTSSWYDDEDDDDDDPSHHQCEHPKDQEALQDCTIAILLNPQYTKAYIRRATIYEQRCRRPRSNTELALQDMLTAQTLEPNNRTIATQVRRLQQLEQERMEQIKAETMSKLKDLGNSILSNFGLSLDNFQAQQDPNTGSYNISFSQK
jgi:hypothetical protein